MEPTKVSLGHLLQAPFKLPAGLLGHKAMYGNTKSILGVTS